MALTEKQQEELLALLNGPEPNTCTLEEWEAAHPGAPFPEDREPAPSVVKNDEA